MSMEDRRRRMERSFGGRVLLTFLSWFYGFGVMLRTLVYRLRILKPKKLPVRTVVFGNITAGGAGKTTAVLMAAQLLRKKKHRVAILSRGYNRLEPSKDVRVLLDTQNVPWEQVGDEPWMMHHALQGLEVPILVSPNRYKAGMEAADHYDPQVILLDDGFQHLQLDRQLNVLLINATDPFGGERLLPRGNLREPMGAMRRADIVVLTHSDQVKEERLTEIRERIQAIAPNAEVLEAAHKPDFLFNLKTQEKLPLEHLKGKTISAFSAIGDPESFEAELKEIGAKLRQAWRFPDHHPYSEQDLRSIDNARRGDPVVTTFKDLPRLGKDWQGLLTNGDVLAIAVRMEIVKGQKTLETELCKGLRG